MPLKKFGFIRITLPFIIAVGIHVAVIGALLYVTMTETIKLPKQEQRVMSVTMVNPADFAPPPKPQVAPEPEPEPEVKPEPPPPEAVPLPEPKPKPKAKPVEKPVERAEKPKLTDDASLFNNNKPDVKPAAKPSVPATTGASSGPRPLDRSKPQYPARAFALRLEGRVRVQSDVKPAAKPSVPATTGASSGPRPLDRSKPQYPARAFALRLEGRVRVQFDVDSEGHVDNVRILSAEPRNMFEREVKQAMRKWRYEPKAANDLVVNLVFKINGGTSVE